MRPINLVAITFVFLASVGTKAATVTKADFVGSWIAQPTMTKGETARLSIASDYSSLFYRRFEDGHEQSFKNVATEASFVDDLLIINVRKTSGSLVYKLVISGWKSQAGKLLFGMMYMYHDNEGMYNGIPVTLRPNPE